MRDYFWGLYFKCQSEAQTLALIPALHTAGREKSCSIQIITGDGAWNIPFPAQAFHREGRCVTIGGNVFSEKGIRLNLRSPQLTARGFLRFGPLSPIQYDIMGPFSCVPFLECRHSVYSMLHAVEGRMEINHTPYLFAPGFGYLEGDRGRSFPREYAWVQTFFPRGSLMLSVADIPFCGFRFTGVIGIVRWQGREYRLATYLGAKVLRKQGGELAVQQGRFRLTVRLPPKAVRPLRAPVSGAMARTIFESAACRASCRFQESGHILFDFETDKASFEYEFPD